MKLYQTLAQSRTLARSWNRLQTKGKTPGVDGVTFEEFNEKAARHLQRLAAELKGGTYAPLPLRGFAIPKSDGGSRTIAIATVRDRVVQGGALQLLMPWIEPLLQSCSYAYRPGRSHEDALARVRAYREQGYEWIAEADVASFFDTVPHADCLNALRRIVDDTPFLDLLNAWLTVPIVGAVDPRLPGTGLPQGLCLSPLLSNFYLDAFDRAMTGSGHELIRFADDFVVLCRSRAAAYAALRDAERILAGLGLRLRSEKSAVTSFEEGFNFLGGEFEGSGEVEPSFAPAPRGLLPSSPFKRPLAPVFVSGRGSKGVMILSPSTVAPKRPAGDTPGPPPTQTRTPPTKLPVAEDPPQKIPAPPDEGGDGLPVPAMKSSSRAPSRHPFKDFGPAPGLDRRGISGRTLFINRQGCLVRTRAGRYEVTHPDELKPILSAPSVHVDAIVVIGAGTLSSGAVVHCLREGIPVHFVSLGGHYHGGLVGEQGHDAARLQAQVIAAATPEAALDLARRFVHGKIRNSIAHLRRAENRHPDAVLQDAIREQTNILRALRRSDSVDGVRGYEGAASAAYFGVFERLIRVPDFTFPGRVRRPPTDPVNALLSFGYTLLHTRLHTIVRLRKLHPFVGFLHVPKQGHAALVSDLQEEWRPLVDALVLSVINKRLFPPSAFEDDGAGGIRLVDDARRKFVARFEAFLSRRYRTRQSTRRLSYIHRMDGQVRRLVRHLEEAVPYVPFRWR